MMNLNMENIQFQKGAGYWKYNSSLNDDLIYTNFYTHRQSIGMVLTQTDCILKWFLDSDRILDLSLHRLSKYYNNSKCTD